MSSILRAPLAIISRLYRFAAYVYRFAVYVQWVVRPAFRVAANTSERVSVARFALQLIAVRAIAVIVRLAQGSLLQDDTSVMLRGTRYYVGVRANELALFGEIYNDRAYDQVADFVPKAGWILFDVGANIGVYAVQQALRGARVYAFEPNPDCHRRLARTIRVNGLQDKITLSETALGAARATGTMVIADGFTPGGSVVALGDAPPEQSGMIQIRPLDEVTSELAVGRIDLLKIDTEGAEEDVLRGASHTLPIVKRIVLEYHSHSQLERIKTIVAEHGFREVLKMDEDPKAGRGVFYAKKDGLGAEHGDQASG